MNNFLVQPFKNFLKASQFTEKLLEKCCLGSRVIDILFHFPVSVQNRSGDINNFKDKEKLTVILKIIDHAAPRYKSSIYKVFGETTNGDIITIRYFNYNSAFIRRSLPIGEIFVVSGVAQRTMEGIQITHPDVIASSNMLQYYIGPELIYPLISKLQNRTVQYAVSSLLKAMPEIPDWVTAETISKNNLMTFTQALKTIHNPRSFVDESLFASAKKRIAIDELLVNQIRLKQMRESISNCKTKPLISNGDLLEKLVLPFDLTVDQKSCLEDIKKDLSSGKPMNRLIQGDVGSGKTIVAFIAMLIALENKVQATFLVPTEILATQHFESIRKMSENLGIKIDIILSSNRRRRSEQIKKLKNGETQILIGTHALFEDNIEFGKLGLVIIDEQHRFGVMQRLSLIKKCQYPNILAMSATPIPRTLLLGFYRDLDVSTIKTKPEGRKIIKTTVIGVSKINDLIARLREINSQIYWICPVIEESETLMDINTRYEYITSHFSRNDVFILHGKMKMQEKDEIICRFKKGEFKILISTTVVEVGVNILNANVIVIEHAERFGLAQLHQLRGRVGRGNEKAYCVLLYHSPLSNIGKKRLQLMKTVTDGFLLSEEDLKLRGAGDILGKEQSGFNSLRFSDFSNNYDLIKIAEEISRKINPNNIKFLSDIFKRLNEDIIA
ncbi:MAG: ATP-dependent DNA helicase RecG [Holosporaceae bacterium]|jgi:ATP-dependent DNA helicase RecG|nr:ATP-dependent DNA helicase RecG [Holosporaceae bacterium]